MRKKTPPLVEVPAIDDNGKVLISGTALKATPGSTRSSAVLWGCGGGKKPEPLWKSILVPVAWRKDYQKESKVDFSKKCESDAADGSRYADKL